MSTYRLHGGILALCLLLSCRFAFAQNPGAIPPANSAMYPATASPVDFGNPNSNTPALMALPVTPSSGSGPSSGLGATTRKWYTITASLREIYDDNVNTTKINQQSSLETSISPSLLVDFPSVNGDFSGRYTFGATYYGALSGDTTQTGVGTTSPDSLEYTNELDLQYTHNFSDRFNMSVADDLRYLTDPSLFQSTGTAFRIGPYIVNSFSAGLTAQWTPLINSSTSYSNTLTNYLDSDVAQTQNGLENTFSQSIGFNILPTASLNFGGIYDDNSYETASRGYTSYTGYTGVSWQALPNLSASVRAGGTYTETVDSQIQGVSNQASQSEVSPYAALSVSWVLGARSSLSFDYSHEITPSDNAFADGQSSDRISTNFSYQISPSISTHLQAIYTLANVTPALVASSTQMPYDEGSYALDTGISYHYSYVTFDFDYTYSGVSSQISDRDYTRNQVSIGVTGSY